MGRITRGALASALVIGAVVGLAGPRVADAAPDTRIPTAFEGGGFVLATPARSGGLGSTSEPKVLTAWVKLHGASGVGIGLKQVTFTSGGVPVCSAVTRGALISDFLVYGQATCSVNPLTVGGLRAILTGQLTATFAGDDVFQPTTIQLKPIGPGVRYPCIEFC